MSLRYFELYPTLFTVYIGLPQAILVYLSLSRAVLDYLRLSRAILDNLWLSLSISISIFYKGVSISRREQVIAIKKKSITSYRARN